MKIHSLIIKDSIVVDKCVGTKLVDWHPVEHDYIIEDISKRVPIGAIYNSETGEFSVYLRPYDEIEDSE